MTGKGVITAPREAVGVWAWKWPYVPDGTRSGRCPHQRRPAWGMEGPSVPHPALVPFRGGGGLGNTRSPPQAVLMVTDLLLKGFYSLRAANKVLALPT